MCSAVNEIEGTVDPVSSKSGFKTNRNDRFLADPSLDIRIPDTLRAATDSHWVLPRAQQRSD